MANFYYDAYVEGYLFENNVLIRSGSASGGSGSPNAYGYMGAPAASGSVYQLESDHYLLAAFAYYDSSGYPYYSNPSGFWFAETGNPTNTSFNPTGGPAYVVTQFLYLGTTAVSVLNAQASTTIPFSDLSYLNELDAYSFISRQERERIVNDWNAAIVAAIAANITIQDQNPTYVYPVFLTVFRDCSRMGDLSIPTVSSVRYRTYQIRDQFGRQWDRSQYPITIKENIIQAGGASITGGGVWSSGANTITRAATFEDKLTAGGFPVSNQPGFTLQQFYADGGSFATPQTAMQIIDEISARKGIFGTLSTAYFSDRVSINGDGGAPRACQ